MKTLLILALVTLAYAQTPCSEADRIKCRQARTGAGTPARNCAADEFPTVSPFPECCESCLKQASASCTDTQIRGCQSPPPPYCTAGQVQGPDPARPCCPNCVKQPCTSDQERACMAATIPTCTAGQYPTRDAGTCCPSCRPPAPAPPTCASPDPCAAGVTPTRNDAGCYSCVPSNGRPDAAACTDAQLQDCKAKYPSLAVCPADQPPTRSTDCCPTCRVPDTPVCTENQVTACRNGLNAKPECGFQVAPVWDKTTCCVNCKPTVTDRPDTEKRCSDTAFKNCINSVRVCNDGEEPVQDATNFCCPTCKRPERRCPPDAVVKCLRDVPFCPAGTRPSYVLGDCCPSCVPPLPQCPTACAPNEVCVPQKDATTGARVPTCRSREQLRFKLASKLRAIFAGLTDDDVRRFMKELVERYCDKNEAAEACKRFRDEIDGTTIDVQTLSDNSVDVTVNVPRPKGVTPNNGIRGMSSHFSTMAASDSPSALYVAAMADGERTGEGLTVSYGNSAMTLAPAALLVAALVSIVALFN